MARSQRSSGKSAPGKGRPQRKVEQIRRAQRARAIRIRVLVGAGAAVVIAAIAVAVALAAGNGGSGAAGKAAATAPMGPEGMISQTGSALAPASTSATGQTVDGIGCNPTEHAIYHIHAHVAVYVNGAARLIPLGIGTVQPNISQTANGPFTAATHCYYWLHTHANDGIIHIESPIQHTFTLGNFFDLWRQPLNSHQAGPASGTVTAFLNGTRYRGDPRAIPLTSRAVIQLDVGSPVVPPVAVDWSKSGL